MGEGPEEKMARLDERDTHILQRLDRMENKIDVLGESLGVQKVTVAKWSGTISLLVTAAGVLVTQAFL